MRYFLPAVAATLLAAPAFAAYSLPSDGPAAANLPAKTLGGRVSPQARAIPFSTNLVVNGSFESGDFSGWNQVNDTSFTFVTDEVVAGGPTDGSFHAAFGPVNPSGGGIIQTITTVAGGSYTLSFDLANLASGPNAFGLFWDGAFIAGTPIFEVDQFDYESISFTVTASGTSTDLGFIFYHEPSFWLLDNVSLTSGVIPEPATWAMMIAGFGLIGAAARRRRAIAAA